MAPKKEQVVDRITAEYDVFITPKLQEQLYLLQFPTREREKPYNEETKNKPLEMRVKPRSGFVEIDVPISTSFYYDKVKARSWGDALSKSKEGKGMSGYGIAAGFSGGSNAKVPGQRGSRQSAGADPEISESDDESLDIKHQTLGGQIIKNERGKPIYMIGTFRGSELHLTKLSGTAQMRPQFHYIDAKSHLERSRARRDRETSEAAKPAEARIVHQTVKSSESENLDTSNTKELLQAAQEEQWSRLAFRDQEDDEAYSAYHHKLFVHDSRKAPRLWSTMNNEEYLDAMSAPRLDPNGRARVKPATKKQKAAVEISDSDDSPAEAATVTEPAHGEVVQEEEEDEDDDDDEEVGADHDVHGA